MNTFYQRLLEEKTQLDERYSKLKAFLDSNHSREIDPQQVSLLRIQIEIMHTYSAILSMRIALLQPAAAQG